MRTACVLTLLLSAACSARDRGFVLDLDGSDAGGVDSALPDAGVAPAPDARPGADASAEPDADRPSTDAATPSSAPCDGLCGSDQFCDVCVGPGPCRDVLPPETVCAAVFAPECACDGTTYSNGCHRLVAGAGLLHRGECLPGEGIEPEPELPEGVCADDSDCDVTQFCEYPEGVCGTSGTGFCIATPRGGLCGSTPARVCGCDGVSYLNDCQRHVARVSARHRGDC